MLHSSNHQSPLYLLSLYTHTLLFPPTNRPTSGGHLWFYRIRSKISSIIESTIFTSTMFCSTLFLLYRIGSTVFVSTDVCSKQLMQPHDYCLQEYALQEHDLHPVGCKGMAIQPPSAAIKSEQNLRGFYQRQPFVQACSPQGLEYPVMTSTWEYFRLS